MPSEKDPAEFCPRSKVAIGDSIALLTLYRTQHPECPLPVLIYRTDATPRNAGPGMWFRVNASSFLLNTNTLACALEAAHATRTLSFCNSVKDTQLLASGLRYLGENPRVSHGNVSLFPEEDTGQSIICTHARMSSISVPSYMRSKQIRCVSAGLTYGAVLSGALSSSMHPRSLFSDVCIFAGSGALNTATVNSIDRATRGIGLSPFAQRLDAKVLVETMRTAHVPGQKYLDAACFALSVRDSRGHAVKAGSSCPDSSPISDGKAAAIHASFKLWQAETAQLHGLQVSGDLVREGRSVSVIASFKPSA